ncbi:MAG: peptidyl-prolyl cis-trans isomerase [Bacteroidetes bacterium]|nr:peptidyl-prolyl cis-trans isomerase [Bacteroidota bacterium]
MNYNLCTYSIIAFCLGLFLSCSPKDESSGIRDLFQNEEPVARVFDSYLYPSDLKGLVSPSASRKDSVDMVKNYVDSWVRQQLMLQVADKNLSSKQKDIEKRLKEYENSLLIYMYENELVKQKLDTAITDIQIEAYYNEHKNNFQLKTNILKLLYVKLEKESKFVDSVRILIQSNKIEERRRLENYCYQYAVNYILDDESWRPFDEVIKQIPFEIYSQEHFLRHNKYLKTSDSSYTYILFIKDYMIKENNSPLEMVRSNIKHIIINKRKIAIIDSMYKSLYQQAILNNDFEVNL